MIFEMLISYRWTHHIDTIRIGERQRLAVDDRDVECERVEAFHATEVDSVTVLAVLASNSTVRIDAAGLAEIVAHDFVVPKVHGQVALIGVRSEVGVRNVGWRQHRTPASERQPLLILPINPRRNCAPLVVLYPYAICC